MPLHSELIFQSKTTYYDKTGKSYEGPSVDSKYLTDSNGNYVINPTSPTGEPYIIPANMDFDSLIKVFEGFHTPEKNRGQV